MVILITGASHCGKTKLAQRILEKTKYPYISIDHIKMGLIRSGNTKLSVEDDEELTLYLWPIIKEMIKTVIENNQSLIIEGCYIPGNYRTSFEDEYLKNIKLICLAFSYDYIDNHFDDIIKHSSDIERRMDESDITIEKLKEDNKKIRKSFNDVYLINDNYEEKINMIINEINEYE